MRNYKFCNNAVIGHYRQTLIKNFFTFQQPAEPENTSVPTSKFAVNAYQKMPVRFQHIDASQASGT